MSTTSFCVVLLIDMVSTQKRATWLPVSCEYCKWTLWTAPRINICLSTEQKMPSGWSELSKKHKVVKTALHCSHLQPNQSWPNPSPHLPLLLRVIWIKQSCILRTCTASALRGEYMHPLYFHPVSSQSPQSVSWSTAMALCRARGWPLM